MKNEKRYSKEQILNFSRNFVYLCDECMLSKYDLTDIYSSRQCFSENTYRTVRNYCKSQKLQLSDWCPQDGTITGFIRMFGKYYYPPISVNDIMNKDLTKTKFIAKEEQSTLDFYTGIYFCYYRTIQDDMKFGIIKIDNSIESRSVCQAVLGFNEKTFFDVFLGKYTLEQIENERLSLKEIANQLTQDRKSVRAIDRNFMYYDGNISILAESMLMVVTFDRNSLGKIITFKRYDKYKNPKFIGALGEMITTTYVNRPVKFQKIILSRYNIYSTETIDKITEALKIDAVKNNEIVCSSDTKNQEIFDLIRKCEPEV